MHTEDISYRLISPRRYGTVAQTPTAPQEALENVNERPLVDGSLCIVGDTLLGPGGLFVLSKSSALVADNLNILPTFSGVGRWIRLSWNPVMPQARERAAWVQFGEILVPAATLEANAVVLAAIGATVINNIGYDDTYLFEATASIFGRATTAEGTTVTAGWKFQWDLNGDGVYETDGARITGLNLPDDVAYESLVLRERRSVAYAALGVTPAVRLVGWDVEQTGGWASGGNPAGGIQPNSLEFVYGNA